MTKIEFLPATLLKYSFLKIFSRFSEQLFFRTPLNGSEYIPPNMLKLIEFMRTGALKVE